MHDNLVQDGVDGPNTSSGPDTSDGALDADRLLALDPAADVEHVAAALHAIAETCDGAGPAGGDEIGARFRWLTAPRSTVIQPGPVHTGLTSDPAAEQARLLDVLVRAPVQPAKRDDNA